MSATLQKVPVEIFDKIISYLSFDEFMSFMNVNQDLFLRFHSEGFSRQVIRKILHSYEGKLAEAGVVSHKEAVLRACMRKEAFTTARPWSAIILGYGCSYVYEDRILCYSCEGNVRVLDVCAGCQREIVADVKELLLQAAEGWLKDPAAVRRWAENPFQLNIIHCEHGIVSFLIIAKAATALVAIDFTPRRPLRNGYQNRIRFFSIIRGQRDSWHAKQVVLIRNTKKVLYFCYRSPTGDSGDLSRWNLWLAEFDNLPNGQEPEMTNLFRTWTGSSIVLKIHTDGYIYILTNQTAVGALSGTGRPIDEYESDSYYQCYRFPLDSLSRIDYTRLPTGWELVRIHRPWPKAIPNWNISWADLSLHQDERTGNLVIIECQQSSQLGAQSLSMCRCCSFQPLTFPERSAETLREPPKLVVGTTSRAPTDQQIHTLRRGQAPLGQRPHDHRSSYPRSTKYRAYNLSASAHLDITLDYPMPTPAKGETTTSSQRVHLHVGPRKTASPIDPATRLFYDPTSENGREIRLRGQSFVDGDVKTWPPPNAPAALWDLLNPFPDRPCSLRANSDERSIVYKIGLRDEKPSDLTSSGELRNRTDAARKEKERQDTEPFSLKSDLPAIILVNFDAYIDFPGLQEMHLDPSASPDDASTDNFAQRLAKERINPKVDMGNGKENVAIEKDREVDAANPDDEDERAWNEPSWFRKEPAMWTKIGRGFRFTYGA